MGPEGPARILENSPRPTLVRSTNVAPESMLRKAPTPATLTKISRSRVGAIPIPLLAGFCTGGVAGDPVWVQKCPESPLLYTDRLIRSRQYIRLPGESEISMIGSIPGTM